MANTVKTTFTADVRPMDRAVAEHKRSLDKLAKDIERMQRDRQRNEERLSQNLIRNAEREAQAKIRAQQRATQDIIRELRKIEREEERQATARRQRIRDGIGTGAGYALGGLVGGGYLAKQALDSVLEQSRAQRLLAASATEAGLAQGVLAQKNREFASSIGLSTQAAAETTSQITRLATNTGNSGQLDQLLKAFADLSAARGIQGGELNALIGTILSGQDEGLNRLGIADPGKLYEAYAKAVGKTTEELSQMEKVQAAVNAVLEKAGIFAGAAEARMNSLEGQVAKSAATWKNFTDALSNTFITSGPVTDFLNEASRLLGNLKLNLEQVNSELAKGKSPRQIAEEQYPTPTWGDWLTAGATSIVAGPALGLGIIDSATFSQAVAPSRIRGRRLDTLTNQIAAQQQTNTLQGQAAEDQARATRLKKLDEQIKAIGDAQKARAEIAAEKQIELDKKVAEQAIKLQEDIAKAKDTLFDRSLSGQNNPFLDFLGNANREMRSMLETAKVLSPALQAAFRSQLQEQNRNGLFGLRLDTAIDAQSLRRQAAEFRQGYRNDMSDPATVQRILTEQFRALGISQRSAFSGGQFYNLNRDGSINFASGTDFYSPQALTAQQRALQDQKLLNLAGGLDPKLLTGGQREIVASAFEREATRKLDSEKNANDFFTKMVGLISDGGLKVSVGGSGSLVTIKNEAPNNAVVTNANAGTTAARY